VTSSKPKLSQLKATVMTPNAPAYWPSVSTIFPEFIRLLESIFPKIEKYDPLSEKHLPKKSDLWIFPSGTVQSYTLNWLRACYPNPQSRPPAIFLIGGEGAKLAYHLFHYRALFRPDDQWVVACEAEKALLEDFFPENGRTHVMYHPVASQFRPAKNGKAKQQLRKALGLPGREPLMLYAGRLSQQKNLLPLFELLQLTPKLKLIICGDVDTVGVPHLQGAKPQHVPSAMIDQIRRLGLSKRVEFRPFLSQNDLRAMMQACDYQVSLSAHYGEDFGYSIAQGLCTGLKTILSNWGGHRNWMELHEKGHVSYVALDWSNGAEIGLPVLNEGFKLPERALPPDFYRTYQRVIRDQFMSILWVILQSALTPQTQGELRVDQELADFWGEVAKRPSAAMYSSTAHPLFKRVVRRYQGLKT
jgi:glycosyltransferase involved in cell wall biosynthesis